MAEETIDRLAIEIDGDAATAVSGINRLTGSLKRLDKSIPGPVGKLTQLQGSIKGLSSSAGAIPIQKLQALGNVKVSKTTANGIAAIGKAVEGLPGAARMAAFGSMARSHAGPDRAQRRAPDQGHQRPQAPPRGAAGLRGPRRVGLRREAGEAR